MNKSPIQLIFSIIILACIVFISSCNPDDPAEPNEPLLRSISAEEQEIIQASNDFSFDLFASVNSSHPSENVFISPFSISTALSMTLNGAEGETLKAMKETLHVNELTEQEINEAYKSLADYLLQLDNTVNLQVANSNWYRNDLVINESFESSLQKYYNAEVKPTDFDDPATLDQINGWIEDKTNGKIKDMLDAIPGNILMYLINAVYFKADWQYQFDKNQTAEHPFQLSDGSSVNVPTMYSEGITLGFSSSSSAQLLDIPYGNGQYMFTVVLPNDAAAINALVETFSADHLAALLADTNQITTHLYMPKFKLEFKEELKEVLTHMGMGIAFSGEAAFGRLFENNVNANVSRVLHQSFLEVNEEGSEAAAATVVEIVETSAGPPAAIKINRPFLFFIREKHSNTILFSGKLMNPEI